MPENEDGGCDDRNGKEQPSGVEQQCRQDRRQAEEEQAERDVFRDKGCRQPNGDAYASGQERPFDAISAFHGVDKFPTSSSRIGRNPRRAEFGADSDAGLHYIQ
ncbi:MAG: hypothetical protein JW929_10725 [Anaerolineales bacterium]|nr:hypothetical protein [Anaerolineales bacterium]